MRTLTAVFAPGSAPLPEGLRTLHVSPGRVIEPGQTIHASFTFKNLGGGTASGFRVRFRLPEGLTYLVGTARIDDEEIDEQGGLTSLLQSSGAKLGDVPAGGERRISLAYSVASTIENGTQIALQAAIASFEVPVIGSNVVRLVVRSRPMLQSTATRLTLTPVREAVPGAELQLRAQIHNSGQSSAHDVIALLPVPPNTTYIERSATVGGRERLGLSEIEPFGLTTPVVVTPTLGPGATLDVGYRVRIDPTLDDNAQITASGGVCTQELPEFALSPVTLKVPSKPSFDGEETSLRVEADDEVVPGQRVRVVVHLRNAGTARARDVRARVKLPEGLAYSAGSRAIDGAPAADRGREPGLFQLGDVEPGRSVEVALVAVVASPIAHDTELPLEARVEWSKGNRAFTRTLTVRSAAAFPAAFNRIEREGPRRLAPGEVARFTVHVENMGTDVATDARLELDADAGYEPLKMTGADGEIAVDDDGVVRLDALEPNAPRTLHVETRVAPTVDDQAQLRVRATLKTAKLGEIDLGSAQHTIASRPRFSASSSKLAAESSEVLRPNRTAACRLTVHNEGTDRGKDVRVRLQLPEELRLESVDGAARDAESVVFGEVPAQQTREATIHLRLLGIAGSDDVLEVGARLSGSNVVPLSLEPIQLATHAEPAFDEGASLTSQPAEAVDAGEEVLYTLALRNTGDGVAHRINARVVMPTNAVYAPGSTTVNGVPLLDNAGTSPLLAPSGLTLGEVGSGVEMIARLAVIVNTPLPPGTTIETRANVTWDDAPEMVLRAEPLRVRSAHALPIVDPALPFSVLDAAAAPSRANGRPRALAPGDPDVEYIELPPPDSAATAAFPPTTIDALPPSDPTRDDIDASGPQSSASPDVTLSLSKGEPQPNSRPMELSLQLPDDRLQWIARYLDEAGGARLIAHLMMIRALFPDTATDASVNAALKRYGSVLNELVDRLFVKMRLPNVELVHGDLETDKARASLTALLEAIRTARASEHDDARGATGAAGLSIAASIDPRAIEAAAAELPRATLATAAPWSLAAMLIGTSLRRDGETVADFTRYRDALALTLASFATLSPAEFERALYQRAGAELERERERVVRELVAQRNVPA
ncbi:MAG TPA: hypothetical protein VHS78_10215 [Candidatus Elarobacter sp.]|nr:hypothetical protein [Candidatus Elarobacter sp.]